MIDWLKQVYFYDVLPEVDGADDELVRVLGEDELGAKGGVRLPPPHSTVSLLLKELGKLRSR